LRAVKARNSELKIQPVKGNGLKQCGELLEEIEKGNINANFMEGMGCPGGCVGGPGTIIKVEEAVGYLREFAQRAKYFSAGDNPIAHGWMEDYFRIADTLSKKMSMKEEGTPPEYPTRSGEYLS